jgi:outer membrane receptor protein involved in Fe transport
MREAISKGMCGAAVAFAAAAIAGNPAVAQDAAQPAASTGPAAAPAEAAEATGGLEDIVVTARRRTETAQNVPIAITALTGEQMARYDLTNIDKIASLTPQFQVGRSAVGSGAQLTLRGIGSNSSSIGIEQSVAVIVDGVYYGNGRVISEGFFDLSRFELLKGPQALFFGKNATAGVISLTTASPTDTWQNSSRIGYEFKAQQLYGEQVFSGPLTDTLGIRAAVRVSKMFGGYTDGLSTAQPFTTTDLAGGTRSYVAPASARDLPQEREYVGRLTLAWDPTDRFSANLKLSGTINRNNDPAWNNIIFSCPGGTSQVQPTVRCRRDWFAYHNAIPADIAGPFPLTKDGKLETDYKSWGATGTFNYNLDALALTAVLNYHRQDNRFVGDSDYQQRVGQIWVTDRSIFRNVSGEFRAVSSFDGPFNFLAGLYLQDTRRTVDQNVFNANLEDSRKAPEDRYVAFGKESYTDGRTASPYV